MAGEAWRRRCGYGACLAVAVLFATVLFMRATTISNGLGEDDVHIAKWVLKKGLRKTSVRTLSNPQPQVLNADGFEELKRLFAERYPRWILPITSADQLGHSARYQYTYFPGYTPVDVFELAVGTGEGQAVIYFHVEVDGSLFPALNTRLPAGPVPAA